MEMFKFSYRDMPIVYQSLLYLASYLPSKTQDQAVNRDRAMGCRTDDNYRVFALVQFSAYR